jgi:hypothetical protein
MVLPNIVLNSTGHSFGQIFDICMQRTVRVRFCCAANWRSGEKSINYVLDVQFDGQWRMPGACRFNNSFEGAGFQRNPSAVQNALE